MRSWMALVALLPACGFSSSGKLDGGGGGEVDASTSFGSFVKVRLSSLPTEPINVSAEDLDINTDTGAMASARCDANVSEYCVVAATGFTVAAGKKIRAHGSRPLVLVSTTRMFQLDGEIDVSSHVTESHTGAGAATAASCTNATPPSPVQATGYSGGFGGSFGGRGGDGEQLAGEGELRGTAAPAVTFPAQLRGGCPGGNGAMDIATGGAGGSGGGAVAIIAPALDIKGKINASGSGGHGGRAQKSGGGGGGSGGMIVLDMPASAITRDPAGVLFASGGGGGQGGAGPGNSEGPGADGKDPTGPTPAAAGGVNNPKTDGGKGGEGSAEDTLGGANAGGQSAHAGGGGAGGGAAGFIHAEGVSGNSVIAPPTSSLP